MSALGPVSSRVIVLPKATPSFVPTRRFRLVKRPRDQKKAEQTISIWDSGEVDDFDRFSLPAYLPWYNTIVGWIIEFQQWWVDAKDRSIGHWQLCEKPR